MTTRTTSENRGNDRNSVAPCLADRRSEGGINARNGGYGTGDWFSLKVKKNPTVRPYSKYRS